MVNIQETADLFGVNRTTIWRNMRKLEQSGLIQTQHTASGVIVERTGEWMEEVRKERVSARKPQRKKAVGPGRGHVALVDSDYSCTGFESEGDVPADVAPSPAASPLFASTDHVAFSPNSPSAGVAGAVKSHDASGKRHGAMYKNHSIQDIPQLVYKAHGGANVTWGVAAKVLQMGEDASVITEPASCTLANSLRLPKKISTSYIRKVAAWIREWVDLSVYLRWLGITVYKRNRAGENPCLCPLHDDRHPSFYANRDKGIWYCHACNLSGDAPEMVRQLHDLRFGDATRKVLRDVQVQLLKGKMGVLMGRAEEALLAWRELGSRKRGKRDSQRNCAGGQNHSVAESQEKAKVQVYAQAQRKSKARTQAKVHEKVSTELLQRQRAAQARKYADDLALSANARQYLHERGLKWETVDAYGIGWDKTMDRVVFPNRDGRTGQVVGFTYRALEATATNRYWNTPNDGLYQKGAILFGLHEAVERAKEQGRLYVSEGIFDALLLTQEMGVAAVAMQGTHLTEAQVELLVEVIWNGVEVVLVPDNDEAGEKGLRVSKRLLAKRGVKYVVWRMSEEFGDVGECLGTNKR
ncbi:CHC2 zinc finger domain-containing protein [Brevibacillus dissolubilis]|uniref:CHC2 zinc finger domain-containing protein n=1 Tax=Brevibacillus dissolubilis TaxID=1844116 RepID=UPI00159BD613|nr:CHC2 zinc finger domain-containing protein [Brevibacillus dissolubilis]